MSSGRKCKNCGSSSIEVDSARGDAVCTDCGSVLEDNIIVAEVQYEEGAHGTSNAIGQFVAADSKGGSTKFGASFHVGGGLESREFTLRKARNGISQLGNQLKLNQHCIDTACSFFKMALSGNLTRGRKNSHVYAACVYLSCRTEKTEHLLIDISDVLQLCCYELGRTYLKLSQALCINVPSVDPCLYILRFASKLEFGSKTQQVTNTALRLVQRMKRDSIHSGRRPSGLCGAALLIAARLHEFNRSITDIVKVVKVHESTMRKRLIEFGDTPSSSLTLEEFMSVDLEEEQDPPSFKAARRKDKERLMKIMEEETDHLNELQQQIEQHLEQIKSKSKIIGSQKNLEQVETRKFIHESTIGTIHEIIQQNEDDPKCSFPTELGPDIESIGLPSSLEDTTNAPQERDTNIELNLDFSDIDDSELDSYIMTESEFETKHELWNEINAEYLKKQKEKEEQLKKELEEGKPEKKTRKRATKRTRIGPANSAGEAIERIIQEKKISSKINYEVLKNLNTVPSSSEDTIIKDDTTTDLDFAKRPKLSTSSDVIHEAATKRLPKGRQLVDVGLPFIENKESSPVKNNIKVESKSKPEGLVDVQVVDQEEDEGDFSDDQEEKRDESANQLGVFQMLKQHHQEEGGEDNYDYDDYEYEEDY